MTSFSKIVYSTFPPCDITLGGPLYYLSDNSGAIILLIFLFPIILIILRYFSGKGHRWYDG